MNSVYIIQVFNRLALVFAALNYIFAVFLEHGKTNGLLYIWVSVLTCLMLYVKRKKPQIAVVPMVLIFLPLILSSNIYEMSFMLLAIAAGIFYGVKGFENFDFYRALDKFDKEFSVIAIVGAISLMLGQITAMGRFCAQYVIIVFISYTVLLRALRHQNYNKSSKQFNRVNNIYIIAIAVFSFIISVDVVRNFIGRIITFIYNGVVEIFFYIFQGFFQGIGYVVGIIAQRLLEHADMTLFNKILGSTNDGNKAGKINSANFRTNIIVKIVVIVIIAAIVIYLIVKLAKKIGTKNKGKNGGEFVEEKEFIKNENTNRKGLYARAKNFIRAKSHEEYIRMYYIKFLKLIESKGVQLNDSDTTLDINRKSQDISDRVVLDEIRRIYVQIRYGLRQGDKTMTKRISSLYKQLKK